MTITKFTVRLFGTKGSIYRVHDAKGEVIKACHTLEEAQAWVAANEVK